MKQQATCNQEKKSKKNESGGQILDEEDLKPNPFNYFTDIPAAKTKLVELENANNARQGVLDNYAVVYNAADGKNQQTNTGASFPTLDDISKKKVPTSTS